MISTIRRLLQGQLLYARRSGAWLGWGQIATDQPDLFIEEYACGWFRVGICRACLIHERNRLLADLEHAKSVIRRAKANVDGAMDIVDKRAKGGR